MYWTVQLISRKTVVRESKYGSDQKLPIYVISVKFRIIFSLLS
jgi:hypothetical protein